MVVFVNYINISLLKIAFFSLSFIIVFIGVFVNWFEHFLPAYFLKCYKHSKFSYKGPSPKTIEVPKRWFRHFYMFSSILCSVASLLLLGLYCGYFLEIPGIIKTFVQLVAPTNDSSVSAAASLLAMALLAVHCYKRLYETYFVSVFSDTKMHVGIYMVGYCHYIGAVLAILCEAPGITGSTDMKPILLFRDLSLCQLLTVPVFLWASKIQFDCTVSLANLRKNKRGCVITQKHLIPSGGYFELVSCPHYMLEMVIYLCLSVLLWGNSSWQYVTIWVLFNQIECSLLSHWWYKKEFPNYPQNRKAFLPYLI